MALIPPSGRLDPFPNDPEAVYGRDCGPRPHGSEAQRRLSESLDAPASRLNSIDRRRFLAGLPVTLVATAAGFGPVALALAAAPTQRRLVVVLLRGAMDGLAAVAPYSDPYYRVQRGPLALAEPGAGDECLLDLGGRFGLHPALAPLYRCYLKGELAVVHAVASPYRGRSHFDGQDLLENGLAAPRQGGDSGWLNRALERLAPGGSVAQSSRLGLAIGQAVPLLLRGSAPVGSWAPAVLPEPGVDLIQRLTQLYDGDPILAPALAEGLRGQAYAQAALAGERPKTGAFSDLATDLARFLTPETGPRAAVIELGGWDTHVGQGTDQGRLANAFAQLASGLAAFAQTLPAEIWRLTTVMVVTEFGRTVTANGTGGTDHGTGGCAFLLGGAVAGGRVIADWPGLARTALFEGRDLMPTLDLRAVAKGVLAEHFGLAADGLEATVFPDSATAAPISGLIRV